MVKKPRSAAACRMAAFRSRERRGTSLLTVEANLSDLVDMLVENNLLSPEHAGDDVLISRALSRLVADICRISYAVTLS